MARFFIYATAGLIGLKICAGFFTGFSLYGDEAQYWLWSKNLDFGYFSKPPLLSWFLFGYTSLFGDSFFSLKMFPLTIYLLIAFSIHRLCLKLSLSKKTSFTCAVSFLLVPAASLSSFLISTDLLLLLFWVLAMEKLLEIRADGSIISYCLLGIFLGLSFLSKYAAVYFFLSFLLLILFDKKTLKNIKSFPFRWLFFFLIFIIIISPNIYWNINNNWITFAHTSDNANLRNLKLNYGGPIVFFLSQVLMLGPILFFSFFYIVKLFKLDFENKFLLIFSLPIIVLVLVESFIVRANANWAAPALISLFILFYKFVIQKQQKLIVINFLTNYIIAVFLFSSILIDSKLKMFDRVRGIDDFVGEIFNTIEEADLVVSDRIIFSNISYETKNRPNVIYMPYNVGHKITNHFQISSPLTKEHQNNFYLLGSKEDVSYLTKRKEIIFLKEFDVPFSSSKIKFYEVVFK